MPVGSDAQGSVILACDEQRLLNDISLMFSHHLQIREKQTHIVQATVISVMPTAQCTYLHHGVLFA